ncbi:MAG: hypothetical protein V3G42_09475 [Oscillospiraceae bacterium]
MKTSLKFNLSRVYDRVLVFLFVVYAFYGLVPFFTWDTYHHGILKEIHGIDIRTLIGLGSVALTGLYFVIRGKIQCSQTTVFLVAFELFSCFVLRCVCGGINMHNLFHTAWIQFIILACYMILPKYMQVNVYKAYYWIFAVTLIVPFIYFVVTKIGIHLPYSELQSYERIKVAHHYYYKHYPFAVQIANHAKQEIERRFNGIYDEAGRLGTMAALFLCVEGFDFKKNKLNLVVLVAGIFSFSLAFYVMCFAYFIIKNIANRNFRSVLIVGILALCYVIFINIPIQNENLADIQQRITLTDSGMAGDNRTSDRYEAIFKNQFENAGIMVKLFGYGSGAIGTIQNTRLIDGSSYKSLIFDYGYVGFGLSILWVAATIGIIMKKNPKDTAFFISQFVMYLLNVYQRPTVFYVPFLFITIGGSFAHQYEKTMPLKKISSAESMKRIIEEVFAQG